MGFVTGQYTDLVPRISSGVMYRKVEPMPGPMPGLQKWRLTLEDGKFWFIYAQAEDGGPPLTLTLQGNNILAGSRSFTGFIQVSKISNANMEGLLDSTAGAFPTTMSLSGQATGNVGSYTYSWGKHGQNAAGSLLMYAFKHHVASFSDVTAAGRTGFFLNSTTKGIMEAVRANSWTMVEAQLPTGIDFLVKGAQLTSYASRRIKAEVIKDLKADFIAATSGESWYFSGKVGSPPAVILNHLEDQANSLLYIHLGPGQDCDGNSGRRVRRCI